MEYLKYNCHDLAEQNSELYSIYNKIQQLSNDFDTVFNSLDPQIKSYTDLQKQFTASQTVMADIVARFLSSYNALDQIIDIYYSAERKALQASEDLPVSVASGQSSKSNIRTIPPVPAPSATTASINRSDLILEEWLAELIYKDNR